jgi:hypothetical protein
MGISSSEIALRYILKEISNILHNQMGINSNFEDLEKSIKIIEQRNINQYPSIIKKMDNLARILYEIGTFHNTNEDIYMKFVDNLKKNKNNN